MGNFFTSGFRLKFNPELTPSPLEDPTFDPMLGFPTGRCEREMKATKEEMYSAKIALADRDYCAHKLLAYMSCRKDVYPWAVKCKHLNHAFMHCKHEDFILRMKEYEREKRLRKRQKKIDEQDKDLDCNINKPDESIPDGGSGDDKKTE